MNKFNIEIKFGVDENHVVKIAFSRASTQDLLLTDIASSHSTKKDVFVEFLRGK